MGLLHKITPMIDKPMNNTTQGCGPFSYLDAAEKALDYVRANLPCTIRT